VKRFTSSISGMSVNTKLLQGGTGTGKEHPETPLGGFWRLHAWLVQRVFDTHMSHLVSTGETSKIDAENQPGSEMAECSKIVELAGDIVSGDAVPSAAAEHDVGAAGVGHTIQLEQLLWFIQVASRRKRPPDQLD